MDKLSQKISGWWPSSQRYEPIEPAGPVHQEDEDETLLEQTPDALRQRPMQFSWLDYFIFVLLGTAMLWSW